MLAVGFSHSDFYATVPGSQCVSVAGKLYGVSIQWPGKDLAVAW